MNQIDKSIKKMLGRRATNPLGSFGLKKDTRSRNNKTNNNLFNINKIIGTKKQDTFGNFGNFNIGNFGNMIKKPNQSNKKPWEQWSNFPKQKKQMLRRVLIDTDRDGVPNKYDCNPHNSYEQDPKSPENLLNNWKTVAKHIEQQILNLGYQVKLVTIKSGQGNMEEFLLNLSKYGKNYNNGNMNLPVDAYASISANSNLGRALTKINKNPSDWWARWDSDSKGWEILHNRAMSYQDSNYDAFLINGKSENTSISIINNPNIKLVSFDEAF